MQSCVLAYFKGCAMPLPQMQISPSSSQFSSCPSNFGSLSSWEIFGVSKGINKTANPSMGNPSGTQGEIDLLIEKTLFVSVLCIQVRPSKPAEGKACMACQDNSSNPLNRIGAGVGALLRHTSVIQIIAGLNFGNQIDLSWFGGGGLSSAVALKHRLSPAASVQPHKFRIWQAGSAACNLDNNDQLKGSPLECNCLSFNESAFWAAWRNQDLASVHVWWQPWSLHASRYLMGGLVGRLW